MNVGNFARGWAVVGGSILVGFFLAGCQSGPDQRFAQVPGVTGGQPENAAALTTPASNDFSPDIIKIGDQLVVTFTDLPSPQQPIEDRVRDDGTIQLIQNLTFKAAGKARNDLEKEIHDAYVPKYFKTMTVQIKQMLNTQFYYVDGEVKKPDRQVYISRLTVLKAIASANGFTDFARKKRVILTRANGHVEKVNCVEAQTNPSLDLEVFPGDKIFVERRNPFY
ncbi:MAG TPA: SLBB domain-containing protein [Verrucomicrobiae bacterium]